MGREIKRVALDFDWPLDKVWGGYKNPFYRQCIDCPECGGTARGRGVQGSCRRKLVYLPVEQVPRGLD